MKRLALVGAIATLLIAWFAFDMGSYLTLEQLKRSQADFQALRAESPWLTTAGFFAFYVVVTALSLPGATIMTLAAGALFGLAAGVVLVSFASTMGATLAFLVARFLLRDQIQSRFGNRLAAINRGIERDGAFYLLTLRLVPLFPFFVINLVMGLTPIRARTFYWVSQLGMLPATVVYINAGTQLGAIEAVGDILSPALLASFALLGVFPLLARWAVDIVRRRRAWRGWNRPGSFDRNLVVIGAGAGGLVSAYIAATVKAKVTLVEAGKMGGDCLNTGCVPSKSLIRSARLAHQMRHAERYGLQATDPAFSFRAVMARVADNIRAIEPHDSVERYTGLGVEVVQGHARVVDPWTVEITPNNGDAPYRLSTRAIILATGATPVVPELPGLEHATHATSDTLWEDLARRDTPPRRLVVLGGGPIGCELAQALARLGSQVSVVQHAAQLLPREDEDVARLAREALEADGVRVLCGHEALGCGRDEEGEYLEVSASHAPQPQRIGFDLLLLAVGRSARTTGFGLEELGIPARRVIETNEHLETLYPNIYVVGDAAGPWQFTHTAAHTAWFASVNALFGEWRRFRVDGRVIPHTTFVDPEIARVGLSEREAREQGLDVEITRFDLAGLDRAIVDGAAHGFIKVVTPRGKDRILGATIVGEHAGELLAEFVLAMKHGLGLNKILGTIHTYPTFAEANKYVAGEWKRAHAPQRLLAWLERYHAWKRGGKEKHANAR